MKFKIKSKIISLFIILLSCISIYAQENQKNTLLPQNVKHKILYGANPEAGKYVQTDDTRIYYETYGYGQPIVILHGGLMGSTDEMSEFIERLKHKYLVIAVSTRGHGKSEIGTLPITYEKKANDIVNVINAVTKDSVIILGFSDGAYTGYKVASMYPEKVKKMIAIGAGEQIPGLRKVVALTKETVNLENDFWKQKLALMPEPERLEEFWTSMADFYNTMIASKELFASIKCPVLLMAGELDRNAPLPTIINAYNMIPKSQLSIIPNTGHVVFMENFEAVWASLVPFFNESLKE